MKCSVVAGLGSVVVESAELWKGMSSFDWQLQEWGPSGEGKGDL